MDINGKIKLSPEEESLFVDLLRTGFLKELHHKKMLTDSQLSRLILIQKKPSKPPKGAV